MSTLKAKVILNVKTSTDWAISPLILLEGELGIESDTRLIKIGNGIDTWVNLPYTAISDISNIEGVTITNPTDGQVLTYSNGEWINITPSALPADTDLSHYDNTTSGFITASDIPALPADTDLSHYDNTTSDFATVSQIPTDVSQLNNDAGYVTSSALPSVGDGTITIQQNGSNVASFTTNQATNEIVNITVPTNISAFNNDVGYLTSASLPTVNDGTLTIKQNNTAVGTFSANSAANAAININVPTKTSDLVNDSNFITSSDIPVVNNGTLTIQKNSSTVGTFSANSANNSTIDLVIPTKTSDLTNDLGFITNADLSGITSRLDVIEQIIYNKFNFTIDTSKVSGTTFGFNYIYSDATTIEFFSVDWGDGNTESLTAIGNPASINHTYANNGVYHISVYSTPYDDTIPHFPYIIFYNSTAPAMLISVDSPYPLVNSSRDDFSQMFQGCTNLTSIPADLFKYNTTATSFQNVFNHCSKITSIPADLFRYNTLVTDFSDAFHSCSKLASIPADLFRYNTLVTDFSQTFTNCSTLTTIPEDLFKYNTAATTFYFTFSTCSNLTSIPADLFRYNTATTNFAGVFSNCTKLTSIPADLFSYNTAVTHFGSAFSGCSKLASIPADLFRYNTAANTFRSSFKDCASLTSIPADLFRYNTAVTDFNSVFDECTNLTTIPADLFRYNTAVTDLGYAFRKCTTLTSIPADLFRYNTVATGFSSIFKNCTSLLSIPAYLFKYNTASVNFIESFSGCTKVELNSNIFCDEATESATRFASVAKVNFTNCFSRDSYDGGQAGTAPELWNYTYNTSVTTGCFSGAGNSSTSLTNYNNIPSAWK